MKGTIMAEHVFTDDEIRQIVDVINRTKHTQYIGARYVPIFGRVNEDSMEWNNSAPYEPLTIVLYQGNSYTSRQHVPAGIEITNEQYWANTGNYNAQIEQCRQDVLRCDERATAAQDSADGANSKLGAMGVHTNNDGEALLRRIRGIDTRTTLNTSVLQEFNADTVPRADRLKKQLHNAVLLGVDVDQQITDPSQAGVSDKINELLAEYDLYFPSGTYHLDKPIQTQGHSMTCDDGAVFVADKPMDYMCDMTITGRPAAISGGIWDGKDNANSAFTVHTENGQANKAFITDMYIRNALEYAISAPNYHLLRVRNVVIDGVAKQQAGRGGIDMNYDCFIDNVTVFACQYGFKSRGYNQFSNCYYWAGTSFANQDGTNKWETSMFIGASDCIFALNSVYADCPTYVFDLDGKTSVIGNMYWYSNTNDAKTSLQCLVKNSGGTYFYNSLFSNITQNATIKTNDTPLPHFFGDFIFNKPNAINDANNLFGSNNHKSFRELETYFTDNYYSWNVSTGAAVKIFECTYNEINIQEIQLTDRKGITQLYGLKPEQLFAYTMFDNEDYDLYYVKTGDGEKYEIWIKFKVNLGSARLLYKFAKEQFIQYVGYRTRGAITEKANTLPDGAVKIQWKHISYTS